MSAFTESNVEEAALAGLPSVGWQVTHGPDIARLCLSARQAVQRSYAFKVSISRDRKLRSAGHYVLYDGAMSVRFGEGLFALPIRALWETP